MVIKINTYDLILSEFINNSNKEYYARELGRKIGISHVTILKYLELLRKEKLLIKNEAGLYPTFKANEENTLFRIHKKQFIVKEIMKSGLIEEISNRILPEVIILFGSCGKGEFDKNSDVDLFIEAKEQHINLVKYEKKIQRKIHIIWETSIRKLSENLANNIINGTILHGYIRIEKL